MVIATLITSGLFLIGGIWCGWFIISIEEKTRYRLRLLEDRIPDSFDETKLIYIQDQITELKTHVENVQHRMNDVSTDNQRMRTALQEYGVPTEPTGRTFGRAIVDDTDLVSVYSEEPFVTDEFDGQRVYYNEEESNRD